jgi:hypothetical protein
MLAQYAIAATADGVSVAGTSIGLHRELGFGQALF